MRLIILIFMLLVPTAFAGQGEQDLSKFFDQTPKAPTQSAPAGDSLPDLSKAPKWRDIAAKPEFQALPPAKQFEAKVAYFDYWIAPHVMADGKNVAEVRAEFLRLAPDASVPKERPWGRFGWPHYVVLAVAVIGLIVLVRQLRTRKPSPAIQTKAAAPDGGSNMNDRQRTILIVAGSLIGLLMLYPPFQLHTGLGLGYSWLFFPPKDHAVINASQLLVQWVAVLLIGGIAFVLSGQTGMAVPAGPVAVSASAPESIVSRPETTSTTPALVQLYGAVVGEKGRGYYLEKFAAFDQLPPGLRPSWNWAAFLVGGVWALYRKMYGWFFAFWGIELVTQIAFKVFLKLGSPAIGTLVFFLPWIAFSIYANSLYHRNVKKRIAVAQFAIKDESKLIEHLAYKGGVHAWVIWVFGLIPLIGIVAAVVIPMLARQ